MLSLNISWTPVPIFMKLGMDIMPHEAIWTTSLRSISDHKYQNYIVWNYWGSTVTITRMPEPIVGMRLGTYVMSLEAITTVYFINHTDSNSNTEASKIVLFYWLRYAYTPKFPLYL
jgi:hypothetical protein